MRIALVHDYLTQKGGAERVFALLCKFFHSADIYTSLYDSVNTIDLTNRLPHTTFLQKLPGTKRNFRLFAPLYYPAFRLLDLREYDLIISSTSSFAKAVKTKPGAMHICFCHNVTRFLWNTRTYLEEYNSFRKYSLLIKPILGLMRQADFIYAQEPDLYIANSSTVACRIEKIYRRKSLVINYPIDTNKFIFSDQKEDFYLISSRMISYKRLDIAIEAFNWLGLPLVIIGDGPERKRLEEKALSNIKFLGYVDDQWRTHLMAKAKAVVITALEDYGLVPIEANASGTPVIGYGAGGILDTQISGKTGILFKHQSPEALQSALLLSEKQKWNYRQIRAHAVNNFSEAVFFAQVQKTLEEFCGKSMVDNLALNRDLITKNVLVEAN
ncbi:glycosyl transferase group 1 [Stanieria cyanosphaera PCC 7437]|uniref:Glycosyl transferase group 1 n=1 Tax=Stanieria cyanosphaera (strain ATCC 29371 / PCC 7437) TaxID=111780 RepID=K9XRQ9_STAC7|nr:glycosyltransferase [Stanieria cyanosphaera]AFZ34367.1 glycosyl transferase group 1 [Stanieria cyanosphaera PCC 7437]